MNKPLFETQGQAITVTFHLARSLAQEMSRLMFWTVQLALAVLLLAVLWATEVTPARAVALARDLLRSDTIAVVGTATGLSLAGLVAGYLAAARWLWNKAFEPRWIDRLLQDV